MKRKLNFSVRKHVYDNLECVHFNLIWHVYAKMVFTHKKENTCNCQLQWKKKSLQFIIQYMYKGCKSSILTCTLGFSAL